VQDATKKKILGEKRRKRTGSDKADIDLLRCESKTNRTQGPPRRRSSKEGKTGVGPNLPALPTSKVKREKEGERGTQLIRCGLPAPAPGPLLPRQALLACWRERRGKESHFATLWQRSPRPKVRFFEDCAHPIGYCTHLGKRGRASDMNPTTYCKRLPMTTTKQKR